MPACPCGSEINYAECCGVFINGLTLPTTPEQLMRSRYTAFSQGNINYIEATMCGEASKNFNKNDATKELKNVKWIGLKIIEASPVNFLMSEGFVEFIATYKENGKTHFLHEKSEFKYIENRWYYTSGQTFL